MVGRPSCRLRLNAVKAEFGQIKLIDKDIDRPDRSVLGQIVFQAFRKQRALATVIANHKARHRILPQIAEESYHRGERFHTGWTLLGHRAVTSEMLDGTSAYQLQFTRLF